MVHAKAPEGQHSEVDVVVHLSSGVSKRYTWSAEYALHVALHKAPKWAAREMQKDDVRGRSKTTGISVTVYYMPGEFVK